MEPHGEGKQAGWRRRALTARSEERDEGIPPPNCGERLRLRKETIFQDVKTKLDRLRPGK